MSSIYVAVGYVGSEIEHGQTNNGNSFANWSMAVRSNPKQEEPDWFDFVAYKALADIVHKHVKKGDLLHITRAYPRNRKWTDKDGNPRKSTEFIVNDVELMPNKKRQDQPNDSTNEPVKDDIPFDL
jgi:single stranded DNA-binding protein|tara:strand:- start:6 stop:383 length:378 start_codon:yes stop_codon:yes gene_type:complete